MLGKMTSSSIHARLQMSGASLAEMRSGFGAEIRGLALADRVSEDIFNVLEDLVVKVCARKAQVNVIVFAPN
jgi:hypothetical protein